MSGQGRRIGLFGGSFDPVHNAHLALAHCALDHLVLDELRWLPAGQPWQKQRVLAPADDRAAMVALAIAGEPRFVLDRSELDRPGPSRTIDTVRALQALQPEAHWWLVIGQDQYANLPTWTEWRDLLGRVTLAVAGREGHLPEPGPALADVAHRVARLPMPPMAVSSTRVREALRSEPPDPARIATMVPAAVAGYIALHALYRAPPTPRKAP